MYTSKILKSEKIMRKNKVKFCFVYCLIFNILKLVFYYNKNIKNKLSCKQLFMLDNKLVHIYVFDA